MKKTFLTLVIGLAWYYAHAQYLPIAGGTLTGSLLINNGYLALQASGANTFASGSTAVVVGSGSGTDYINYVYGNNPFSVWTNAVKRFTIDGSGNVGIGTTIPDAKLTVNGTIHTKEVKVDLAGWPDYVFKSNYNLLSVPAIKAYINKNRRLPEMPSEQDVIKNGINLGEIVKLQTKKIEELTLYLIEKDDQVTIQNKQLIDQQKQIEVLRQEQEKYRQQDKRIEALERRLK